MDLVAELQRLEHQLELADRMLATVRDQPTTVRLLAYGEDIKARTDRRSPLSLKTPRGATRIAFGRMRDDQPGGLAPAGDKRLGIREGARPIRADGLENIT